MAWRPSNPPRSESTTSTSPAYGSAPAAVSAKASRVDRPCVANPAAAPVASIPLRNARLLGPPVSGQPQAFRLGSLRVAVVMGSPRLMEGGVEDQRDDVGQPPVH